MRMVLVDEREGKGEAHESVVCDGRCLCGQ